MATVTDKANRMKSMSQKDRTVNGEKNVQSTARRKTSSSQLASSSVMRPIKGPGI